MIMNNVFKKIWVKFFQILTQKSDFDLGKIFFMENMAQIH
jgi:hypothetical protein